jgi:hypothetical protein
MASGDIKLDANGDIVLSGNGRTGLETFLGQPCNCIGCDADQLCDECTGFYFQTVPFDPVVNVSPWCCFGCVESLTINFGDIVEAAGASSKTYYNVSLNVIATLANQSIVLNRVRSPVGVGAINTNIFFAATGLVSQITSNRSYMWRVRVWPPTWLIPSSGFLWDVNWRFTVDIIGVPAFCPDEIGDQIPACPSGESITAEVTVGTGGSPYFVLTLINSAATWRGNCEGPFDPTTPTVDTDYFDSAGDVSLDPVSTCGPASTSSIPSSLLVDFTAYNASNPCFSFAATTGVVNQNGSNGATYGGTNSALCSAGEILAAETVGPTAYTLRCYIYPTTSNELDYECCWRVVLYICTGGVEPLACGAGGVNFTIKTYQKCGDYADPTGTYTEIGGTDTIEVT